MWVPSKFWNPIPIFGGFGLPNEGGIWILEDVGNQNGLILPNVLKISQGARRRSSDLI